MLYTIGTISVNGNTATGTGTNWTAPASQIRLGQTLVVLSNPVQLFQITAINSATSLTVTPAASPAVSGQKYGILVTDALSVDGLAQSISQLINEYDENIGGWETFATTSANQNITVTINGKAVTIPAIGKLLQKGGNGALAVADGGTGAKTAADARVSFGWVNDMLPVALGGTGSADASGARTNLGLGESSNLKFAGMTIESNSYTSIVVRNTSRQSDDVGSQVSLEVSPSAGGRPYFTQRSNSGSNTGQAVNNLPTSSGVLAIQGTSGLMYKRDISPAPLSDAVERIAALEMVNFTYKDDEQNRVRFGIIAEQAEAVAPQYIKHNLEPDPDVIYKANELDDEGRPLNPVMRDRPSIDNNPIVMDLLGAVQFLHQQVLELKSKHEAGDVQQ
ncbi:tail fiber domain-containing protein [Escherichia coli]|uniref:tail fiber domain-containing protein n=1 Tax=Escherichia coli TaxID=562 RepID=UPI0007751D04|nr:tail fiber domain-containing protein [Escherichia coli]EEW3262216.1 tail fiber domain-containing protein [Escherichia coli]EFJ2067223.1 tail fiber domain-containing protein [Escherichia coli]EFK5480774.1 tail fiber domain-containing protein [Escherichia coli]KXP43487.1 phage tail protein [Escherichia coli]MBF2832460.1 tail fiber domain-containing protein [Escherichia coli]